MTIYAEGVDYSAGWPDLAALRAANIRFVVRYVAAGVRGKEITAAEVVHWQAAGINIVIVYETTAGRVLEGRTAGIVDATAGRNDVIAAGGPADGGVIYFACDVDTTSDGQRAAVVDYLTGAASVLGWDQTGLYGEYEVIDYVAGHCDCRWYWQTYAWSGGQLHPRAQLYQYRNAVMLGGVEVDLDRAYAPDFGQWGADMTTVDEIWDDQTPWPGYATDLPHAAPAYTNRDYLTGARVSAGRAARDAAATLAQVQELAAAVAALQAAVTALTPVTPATTADLAVTGTLHLGAP